MGLEDIRTSYAGTSGPWRSCSYCGGNPWTEAEIRFDAGTVAPVVGATLTGGTSGATGVVAAIDLFSGSWAGSDATGYITMTSPTGIDSDGHWGTDNETATTPAGGSVVLNGDGTQKIYGIFYPESDMIFHEGRFICKWHYEWRYRREEEEKAQIDIEEIQDKY